MSTSYVQNYIFEQAKKKVMSQTQGLYPAPLKILDVSQDSFQGEREMKSLFSIRWLNKPWKVVRKLDTMLKRK